MVGTVRGRLRFHPVVAAGAATGIAAIAVLAIARVTGADAVGPRVSTTSIPPGSH